jgi:hypothetical protein
MNLEVMLDMEASKTSSKQQIELDERHSQSF